MRRLLLALIALGLLLPAEAIARKPLTSLYAEHLVSLRVERLYAEEAASFASATCRRVMLYWQECTYTAHPDPGRVGFEIGAYGSAVGCHRGQATVRKFYPTARATYSVRLTRPRAVIVHSSSENISRCLTADL